MALVHKISIGFGLNDLNRAIEPPRTVEGCLYHKAAMGRESNARSRTP